MSEPCPKDEDASAGTWIPADPKLSAEGWQRRHLADEYRAHEASQLYSRMGFEVILRKLSPQDLGPDCGGCPSSSSVCGSYVMIYTRKKER